MRFHVGFSFRLKNLKKFLIPFLLGIGAYFGLSSFNLLQVNAYSNYSTYFNYNYDEIDFDDYIFIDEDNTQYTMQDIIDLANNNNTSYKINIFVSSYYNSLIESYIQNITFRFVSSSYESLDFTIYNQRNSSSSGSNYDNYRIWNDTSYNGFSIDINNQYSGKTSTSYSISSLKDCLLNDNCPTSSNSIKRYTIYTDTKIDNSHSYSIDLWNNTNTNNGEWFYIPYKTEVPLILRQYGTNSNYYYLKSIKVNDTDIAFDTEFPTYCDLYTCSSGGDSTNTTLPNANKLDDFFVSNIDISNLSTTQVHWTFNYFSLDFAESLRWQYDFFGRVDHGTYYSYEPITCELRMSSAFGGDDRLYDTLVDHFSCSSTLSSYDNLYVRFRLSNYTNDFPNLIDNLSLNTNNGYINISPYYNGSNRYYIMDYFSNLPSDFNMLVSTQEEMTDLTYISTNNNILMASVSRDTNVISNFATSQQLTFGTFNNTNAMIYNYTPSYNDTSNVFVFIDKSDIISFVQNGTFTYYDNNNSLSSGAINNSYQVIVDEYDLNYYFGQVNEFINSIDTDLQEVHNILENVFSIMPVFLQLIFVVLYILLLSYLLFKFIRS